MDNALKTIMHAWDSLDSGVISALKSGIFLNAQNHPSLKNMPDLKNFQPFKPYYDALKQASLSVYPVFASETSAQEKINYALILAQKNIDEARFNLAIAINSIAENGIILCAADNNANGARLAKILKELGICDFETISKNKARCVIFKKTNAISQEKIESYLNAGKRQHILGNTYISWPGIYGWNKIDKGSELLARHLPNTLRGNGADFGCGYGYLSKACLAHNPNIDHLTCIDAERRALDCAKDNIQSENASLSFDWLDLSIPQKKLDNTFDWIVMNPPFHEGKTASPDLGAKFIKCAHTSLKKNGALYMVANTQLPYEIVLEKNFKTFTLITQDKGFKIFIAKK